MTQNNQNTNTTRQNTYKDTQNTTYHEREQQQQRQQWTHTELETKHMRDNIYFFKKNINPNRQWNQQKITKTQQRIRPHIENITTQN